MEESGIGEGLKIHLQFRRPLFNSWVRKIPWRRDRLPTPVFLGFPGGSAGKESVCHVGDLGSIPGSGRSPGEGNSYPLQYSGLENPIDGIVHGVAKSETWLSDFHFQFPGTPTTREGRGNQSKSCCVSCQQKPLCLFLNPLLLSPHYDSPQNHPSLGLGAYQFIL